jgi:preprotein translocase SecF subunit
MKTLNITKNKYKFLIIPAIIIVAGIIMFFVSNGFNYDIEFQGGMRMQVDLGQTFSNDDISALVKDSAGISSAVIQSSGVEGTRVVLKIPAKENGNEVNLDEARDKIFNAMKEKYNLSDENLVSVGSASANFGLQVQQKTLLYTLIALLCILVYIAIRFEWRSAVMAIIGLAINILVMMAVYVIFQIPLNTTFIAAMLTVVGYSINNTIVVFDRIRENMKRIKGQTIFEVVDGSVTESMGRTINTTITTLITIVLLYFIGVDKIKEFAFPLIIGVLAGAYTSIFVASPFWASWKETNRLAKIEEAQLARQQGKGGKKKK